MAHEHKGQSTGSPRGFAGMEQEKQREIARKGGANVPHDKRSFAQDRALASDAGRKGGSTATPQLRAEPRIGRGGRA
jgi:general stress protein YciG